MGNDDNPWQSLKRSERLAGYSFIALVSLVLAGAVFPTLDRQLVAIAGVLAALGIFAGYISIASFRCPRCGKQFFRQLWYTNVSAKQCVHCGKNKNEELA